MTTAGIRILREAFITSSPRPGEVLRLVAITYQVPPGPPQVITIPEADLPDLVWRAEHPGEPGPPQDLRDQGDQVRRQRILARRGQVITDQGRVI